MPKTIAVIFRNKKMNITQFMLLSNTIRVNLTHKLWLKKKLYLLFH